MANVQQLATPVQIIQAEVNDLDSLTALPDVLPMGLLADAVYAAAGSLLCAGGRWAEVRDPRSSAFAGIGAFILVRRAALERELGAGA